MNKQHNGLLSVYLSQEVLNCVQRARCCDLELGSMTFKMDRDIDILKLYLVAKSSHSKLKPLISTKITLKIKDQGHQISTMSSIHRGSYSYQGTSISDQ